MNNFIVKCGQVLYPNRLEFYLILIFNPYYVIILYRLKYYITQTITDITYVFTYRNEDT